MELGERIFAVQLAIESKIRALEEDYSSWEDQSELDRRREDLGEVNGYEWISWSAEKESGKVDALTQKAIEERLGTMEGYLNIQYENVAENSQEQTAYEKYGPQHVPERSQEQQRENDRER